jgi:hypothetical protein
MIAFKNNSYTPILHLPATCAAVKEKNQPLARRPREWSARKARGRLSALRFPRSYEGQLANLGEHMPRENDDACLEAYSLYPRHPEVPAEGAPRRTTARCRAASLGPCILRGSP